MQVESSATTLLIIVMIYYAPLITQWLSENKFAWETSISFVLFEASAGEKKILLAGSWVLSFCLFHYFTKTYISFYISCFSNSYLFSTRN